MWVLDILYRYGGLHCIMWHSRNVIELLWSYADIEFAGCSEIYDYVYGVLLININSESVMT